MVLWWVFCLVCCFWGFGANWGKGKKRERERTKGKGIERVCIGGVGSMVWLFAS